MEYRALGSTGIRVSAIAFGAGPVPALMTAGDERTQIATIERAVETGINWFDTAATYGEGRSEAALGKALRQLGALEKVHLATKVRLTSDGLNTPRRSVRDSVLQSMDRLGVGSITLLQLHNSITARRGDEPTSLTPEDVLSDGGVVDAMEDLRREGLVRHIGLTGIGQAAAMRSVVRSGRMETIQVPYHLLNPSAGRRMHVGYGESDYGQIIAQCAEQKMGVLAIRVFAGGALAACPPSAHTYKTPFFPLDLYQRDQARALVLEKKIGHEIGLKEAAVRYVLGHPAVQAAIIGFSEPSQIDEALGALARGPLPSEVQTILEEFWDSGAAG